MFVVIRAGGLQLCRQVGCLCWGRRAWRGNVDWRCCGRHCDADAIKCGRWYWVGRSTVGIVVVVRKEYQVLEVEGCGARTVFVVIVVVVVVIVILARCRVPGWLVALVRLLGPARCWKLAYKGAQTRGADKRTTCD